MPPSDAAHRPSFACAAAQIAVRRVDSATDFAANLAAHRRAMTHAAMAGVDVLVFPELSLTGYELDRLAALALAPDDARLDPLAELAVRHGLTALIGTPLTNAHGQPHIGTVILHPDGTRSAYAKQHLHASENAYATPGSSGANTFSVAGQVCAPAICYDTEHRTHAEAAAHAGASLYLAGVLWSEAGYAADAATLAGHARDFGLLALEANHGAPSGGYRSAGRSAVWAPGGAQLACAPAVGDALVVARTHGAHWQGEVLNLADA